MYLNIYLCTTELEVSGEKNILKIILTFLIKYYTITRRYYNLKKNTNPLYSNKLITEAIVIRLLYVTSK